MSSIFTVGQDYRSAEFKARLNDVKVVKVTGGLHWKFADEQNLDRLSVHMYDRYQRDRRAETYKNFTPYILEVESSVLFNEWYFNFLWNFIGLSSIHQAYIAYPLAEFVETLDGTEEEKVKVITLVQQDFSNAFKECVRENVWQSIPDVFYDTIFTKELIETRAVKEIAEWRADDYFKSEVPYRHREEELAANCAKGSLMPYAMFLMAYDYPEKEIWDKVSACLVKSCEDASDVANHKEILKEIRYSKRPLMQKFKDFAQRLYDELGHYVDRSRPKEKLQWSGGNWSVGVPPW